MQLTKRTFDFCVNVGLKQFINGLSDSSYNIFFPKANFIINEDRLFKLLEIKFVFVVSRPPSAIDDILYSLPANSTKFN
jgi:hypothetical protein